MATHDLQSGLQPHEYKDRYSKLELCHKEYWHDLVQFRFYKVKTQGLHPSPTKSINPNHVNKGVEVEHGGYCWSTG